MARERDPVLDELHDMRREQQIRETMRQQDQAQRDMKERMRKLSE